jgi:hypothetical protein
MRLKIGVSVFGAILACAAFMSGSEATAGPSAGGGAAEVYKNVPPDQIEFLSSPDRIKAAAAGNMGASAVWETLEHGETVECLDCVPLVENLLYDGNAETREIAAWWLRRRIFGVFGSGEAYERTQNRLKGDPDANKRAYAAYALGEFLTLAGVEPLANALAKDGSPAVRAAAADALGRLNDDGAGALSNAMNDGDANVRLAAVRAASKVSTFTDVAAVSKLMGDSSPAVRQRGVELLGTLRSKDTVGGLLNVAKNDLIADVRAVACHSLGLLRDASARSTLEAIQSSDPNTFVQDQARIALRRI